MTLAVYNGLAESRFWFHPGYVSQNIQYPFGIHLTAANASSANILTALFCPVFEPVTIDALAVKITSGAAGNFRLGVYAHNPVTKRPGALLASAAEGDTNVTTANGNTRALAAAVRVTPSTPVWIAYVASAGPTMEVVTGSMCGFLLGSATLASATAGSLTIAGVRRSFTYGALPDPFGTASDAVIGTHIINAIAFRAL